MFLPPDARLVLIRFIKTKMGNVAAHLGVNKTINQEIKDNTLAKQQTDTEVSMEYFIDDSNLTMNLDCRRLTIILVE